MLIHDLHSPDGASSVVFRFHLPDKLGIYSITQVPFANTQATTSSVPGILILGCSDGYIAVFSLSGAGSKIAAELIMLRKVQEQDVRSIDVLQTHRDALGKRGSFLLLTTSFDQRCLVWTVEFGGEGLPTENYLLLPSCTRDAFIKSIGEVTLEPVSTLYGHSDKVLCGLLSASDGAAVDVMTSGADGRLLHWKL